MKERPILFSAPMVRALLDGTKTQTRRVVKVQPGDAHVMRYCAGDLAARQIGACRWEDVRVPYGGPGDRLWVRETWAPNFRAPLGASDKSPYVLYRANGDGEPATKWKPSIFMRRHSSRITLEVTTVRVERLNQITEADAIAEGVEERFDGQYLDYDWKLKGGSIHTYGDPRASYRSLWQSINGPGSWALNPWVWRVEFKKVA